MAEDDTDMGIDNDNDNDKEVSNHMDTDDKGLNHGNDRTVKNELAENAAKHAGHGGKSASKDAGELCENCAENSGISTGVGAKHTEGGGSRDGIAPDDKNAIKSEDVDVDRMATGESSECTEGQGAEDLTATNEKVSSAEEDTVAEKADRSTQGGDTEEGMATDDTNNTATKSLKLFTKDRTSHPSRRSYRLQNLEAGDGGQSDSSDEDERHDTDSGTRSQRSHSDSSETESDMDREVNEEHEEDGEEDPENKTGGAELSSDLEDELLAKLLPKPMWRALPMLSSREIGSRKEQLSFCSKSIGSVHMVSRFEKYGELKHHDGCVNTLHFNQSGNLLASGSDDLNIVLWDWARQKTAMVYPSGHRSNVFQAKFMPYSGDRTIVSCARDGQVRVGELSRVNSEGTKKLIQHKEAAHKLGLEPDSPVVFLTCGEDAVVYNIDLRNSKATKLLTVKEEARKIPLYTIFLNPMNTHEFCVGGRDHFVRIYDRRKLSPECESPVKRFCPHHLISSEARANVTCCVYSYNGREILASYNDEDIYLFDSTHSDGADYIHCYKGHRNNQTVKGVNFYGPESQFIVSGSDCGNVFLWEKTTERIVQYMRGDAQGVVNCLESHPSSAVLATSGLDHDVKIWMPTAKEPSLLEGLKRTMFSNRREREEEKSREPDMIDGHMLMFLMHHLRRRARRQARDAGEMDSDSSTSDSDSSDDEDGDGGRPHERSQCAPS